MSAIARPLAIYAAQTLQEWARGGWKRGAEALHASFEVWTSVLTAKSASKP